MRFWRRKKESRFRTLDEAECYGRSYGDRTADVKTVKLEPRRPRYQLPVSGEELRQRFQERLEAREASDQ